MREVKLTRGYAAFVDDADYERVMAVGQWNAQVERSGNVYAVRSIKVEGKRAASQLMHRFILGITDSKVRVDHKNRYPLDNRRNNLRIATPSQNAANSRARGGTSRFAGVSWHMRCGKWRARIRPNGSTIHLGLFANELDAALAYDVAARKHFGEFAKCNLGQLTGK
ncbi:MAG: AP2 domain-containing protein [Terriglobales bacterium]